MLFLKSLNTHSIWEERTSLTWCIPTDRPHSYFSSVLLLQTRWSGRDEVLNTGCYICNHFWHWHARRPFLFVCSIFIMHYGQCYAAQSLWIICSMVNSRCLHATVCISTNNCQLSFNTHFLSNLFRNFNTLNTLWKLPNTSPSNKIPDFLCHKKCRLADLTWGAMDTEMLVKEMQDLVHVAF